MNGTRALVRCARALTLSRPRDKPYSELSQIAFSHFARPATSGLPTKVPPRRELSETGAVPRRDVMQFPTGHRPVVLEHAHRTRTLESRRRVSGLYGVGHSMAAWHGKSIPGPRRAESITSMTTCLPWHDMGWNE
jgi:hypothetical protein